MSDSATTTTNPQVALVGAHPDGFVEALQAVGFTVEQFSSLLDATTNAASAAVLALSGEEHVLSESDVEAKLLAGTILAFVTPSRALVDTIHKATNTPLSALSTLSTATLERALADGHPLLLYTAGGAVQVDTEDPAACAYRLRELVGNGAPGEGPEAGILGSVLGGMLKGRLPL